MLQTLSLEHTDHAGFTGSAAGQNGGQGGSHFAEAIWYNDSMMGVISGLSEAEIVAQIDAMGAGLGPYNASVSVTAETGGGIALLAIITTTAKMCPTPSN